MCSMPVFHVFKSARVHVCECEVCVHVCMCVYVPSAVTIEVSKSLMYFVRWVPKNVRTLLTLQCVVQSVQYKVLCTLFTKLICRSFVPVPPGDVFEPIY